MTNKSNVLFIELQSPLTDGKAFDALIPGKRKDMLGRAVEFKQSELAEYLANTHAAITAATSEGGEIVGLPIDRLNHDHGDAAGWIVAVELIGDIIRVVPRWTRIGRELISEGIQRFFSATIDLENKTIIGGSLTNWPAIRGEGGGVQLRPIELSEQLSEIVHSDDSHEEAIVMADKKEVKSEKEPDVKVEQPLDVAELTAQIKAELLAEFQAKAGGDDVENRDTAKLEAFASLTDLGEAKKAMYDGAQEALEFAYNEMQENIGTQMAQMMAQMKKDRHIAEFSRQVTSGTDQNPQGLPVGQEEVEAFLGSLNDEQRAGAESILTRTHEQGLIQFSELGHGKRLQSSMTIPAEHEPALTSWVEDGHPISEYFNHYKTELGEMSQYNLDEYKETE